MAINVRTLHALPVEASLPLRAQLNWDGCVTRNDTGQATKNIFYRRCYRCRPLSS